VKKGSYEAAREANIARNNRLLCSLGFPPSIMPVRKTAASMERQKWLSANKPRTCSAAKGENPNPHRTPHPNLLPTHYPIPIPNPNPYPNPNPNPITDEGQVAKEFEEGPPTARRSRGKARERRRDEVTPHTPYPLSYLNRNPYSNPNPNRYS
jgi:hypothetical protein